MNEKNIDEICIKLTVALHYRKCNSNIENVVPLAFCDKKTSFFVIIEAFLRFVQFYFDVFGVYCQYHFIAFPR